MIQVRIVPVTPFEQNCSLLWCDRTHKAAVVDPGGDLDKLKAAVAKVGVTIEKLLVTHGHLDHCGQTGILAKELGVPIEGLISETSLGLGRFGNDLCHASKQELVKMDL